MKLSTKLQKYLTEIWKLIKSNQSNFDLKFNKTACHKDHIGNVRKFDYLNWQDFFGVVGMFVFSERNRSFCQFCVVSN